MRTRVLVLTAFVMPLVSVGIMLAAAEPTGPPPSPAPPPKPEVTALSVSKKAPTDLGVVVIMLTGADNTQTRLLEDVLGLWLRQQRIGVVSRLRVERLLAEEMVKNRGAAEKSQPTAIHTTTIAKNAGANAILVGILHNEGRTKPGEKDGSPHLVRCISLQLLTVESEEVLWTAYGEFDDSLSYIEIARQILASIAAPK